MIPENRILSDTLAVVDGQTTGLAGCDGAARGCVFAGECMRAAPRRLSFPMPIIGHGCKYRIPYGEPSPLPDGRYMVRREISTIRQYMGDDVAPYVVRYCGDIIGESFDYVEAVEIARAHGRRVSAYPFDWGATS